jgi:uncharacterized repeat protein (TIGR03943 family)
MKKTWSPAGVATGLMMASWAAMFWFLMISGRSLLYVSTRTRWVVPTGALILTGAALGRLWSARTTTPEPVRRKEAWILGLMVLPIITVMALPPASLGTYAASRRSSFLRAGFSASAADISSGPLTLIDLASSPATALSQKALQQRAGDQVSFVGIATIYPDTSADEFYLTRFVITCCVADATVAQVHVVDVTPGQVRNGDWVQVDGTFYPLGSEMIVDAHRVTQVAQPHNPYLTPG